MLHAFSFLSSFKEKERKTGKDSMNKRVGYAVETGRQPISTDGKNIKKSV
jgi:hypothetical protein